MTAKKTTLITTHPAVISVWAAILAASSLLPAFPIVGTGATFNIGSALVPLAGILFGPWAGAIAAGIGSFIGQLLAPNTVLFGPLQFMISVFGAAAAGLAMQNKWIWSLAMTLGLGLIWYAFPTGRGAWATPFLYLIGVAAILVGWILGRKWIASPKKSEIFAGLFCASLAGIVVTQAIGNLWALIMFELPPAIWFTVLPIAPIERIAFALAAAIIGTPLMIGLPKISIPVGPMMYEEISEDQIIEEEAPVTKP